MIVAMAKLRIMGPREALPATLTRLQDLGLVHLTRVPGHEGLDGLPLTPTQIRHRRHLRNIQEDITAARAALELDGRPESPLIPGLPAPARARRVRRLRRRAGRLVERGQALDEERALLLKYREAFEAFGPLLRVEAGRAGLRACYAVVQAGQAAMVPKLRGLLSEVIGDGFDLRTRALPDGATALLILAPDAVAGRVERLLGESGVAEMPVPGGYEGSTLAEAAPRMMARLQALPAEQERLRQEQQELRLSEGPPLARAWADTQDELSRLEALEGAGVTARAFVLEGWVPARQAPKVREALGGESGGTLAVSTVDRSLWTGGGEDTPVVLHNPRLFRPFELLVGLLPLPRYGSVDPTPFVAVFFPMFFGLMLGDLGYGTLLALGALLLRRGSGAGTTRRAVAEIAGACAAFTVTFGLLFGECFGDLGRRWLGLQPLWFDREREVRSFLGLAVALGVVHVVLGMVLGLVAAFRRSRRERLGRGISLLMVLLVLLALLAAVNWLPRGFLTPAVIALLAAFPVLVAVEGLVAPVELLATLGTVLSYTRIMALGTASVMLAIVANRMGGALGSALVGVVFGLLFHLVNFALGLFSPAVHALRLHYVEFFGRFYSPGGAHYRPFAHWADSAPARGRGGH